jgi:hypothetical protein
VSSGPPELRDVPFAACCGRMTLVLVHCYRMVGSCRTPRTGAGEVAWLPGGIATASRKARRCAHGSTEWLRTPASIFVEVEPKQFHRPFQMAPPKLASIRLQTEVSATLAHLDRQ